MEEVGAAAGGGFGGVIHQEGVVLVWKRRVPGVKSQSMVRTNWAGLAPENYREQRLGFETVRQEGSHIRILEVKW